jgi:hypothetical protein
LQELKARALLPPDLLFVVSVADKAGTVVASTHSSPTANVADQDYFQSQRQSDFLSVGYPRQSRDFGEWNLHFSRRLNAADGSFAGIVVVAVDADYFVSGYESSKLGEHGVLGILGTDGIFRARRSGETVFAGDKFHYETRVPAASQVENAVELAVNSWDGVVRYTSTRPLYGFPLAVIVGLSAAEQMAAADRNVRAYLWRASAGSLVLIVVVGGSGA